MAQPVFGDLLGGQHDHVVAAVAGGLASEVDDVNALVLHTGVDTPALWATVVACAAELVPGASSASGQEVAVEHAQQAWRALRGSPAVVYRAFGGVLARLASYDQLPAGVLTHIAYTLPTAELERQPALLAQIVAAMPAEITAEAFEQLHPQLLARLDKVVSVAQLTTLPTEVLVNHLMPYLPDGALVALGQTNSDFHAITAGELAKRHEQELLSLQGPVVSTSDELNTLLSQPPPDAEGLKFRIAEGTALTIDHFSPKSSHIYVYGPGSLQAIAVGHSVIVHLHHTTVTTVTTGGIRAYAGSTVEELTGNGHMIVNSGATVKRVTGGTVTARAGATIEKVAGGTVTAMAGAAVAEPTGDGRVIRR